MGRGEVAFGMRISRWLDVFWFTWLWWTRRGWCWGMSLGCERGTERVIEESGGRE